MLLINPPLFARKKGRTMLALEALMGEIPRGVILK